MEIKTFLISLYHKGSWSSLHMQGAIMHLMWWHACLNLNYDELQYVINTVCVNNILPNVKTKHWVNLEQLQIEVP